MIRRLSRHIGISQKPLSSEGIEGVLFDAAWYLKTYPDIMSNQIDPLAHFMNHGWAEGRWPNPLFNTEWYFANNPDVEQSGTNPLIHYAEHGWREGRNPHPLFDTAYYLEVYPDVAAACINPLAHYLSQGYLEGRNPHPLFNSTAYLKNNPDIESARLNPLVHYVQTGWKEGRQPNELFAPIWYARQAKLQPNQEPLTHYVNGGQSTASLSTHPNFDGAWYLKTYADVAETSTNPLTHFLVRGRSEGRRSTPATLPPPPIERPKLSTPSITNPPKKPLIYSGKYIPRPSTSPQQHGKALSQKSNGAIQATSAPDQTSMLFDLIQPDLVECGQSFSDAIRSYQLKSGGKKWVYYTAIFGKYDRLREPEIADPNFDYVCFTDQPDVESEVFQIFQVPPVFESPTKNARLLKALPHIFLKQYDISIWIDGSTHIRGVNIANDLDSLLQNHSIAVHEHFQRKCIYDEAKECIAQKKDTPEAIGSLIANLRAHAFPEGEGLVETAQVIRKSDAQSAQFNEAWWKLIRDYSIRDQLSFNFVSWQNKIPYKPMNGSQWLDQYFRNHLHNQFDPSTVTPSAKVLLIMLVRDSLEVTRKSISSILEKSSYPNFHLVVVDNDSGPDTKSYLSEVEHLNDHVSVHTNAENLSFSKANNDAVKLYAEDAEYILFINNDIEIIDTNWLKSLVIELESDKNIAMAGPMMLYPNYTIQSAGLNFEFPDGEIKIPAEEQKTYRHTKFVDGVSGGCAIVRKDIHELIGGYDERYFYGQEDIDYCLKITEAGFRIKFLSYTEVLHHESFTRRFTPQTLRNRDILRTKWKGRLKSAANSKKTPYHDLLAQRPLNYRSVSDMIEEVRSKASMLPTDFDVVVGIPRSGMIPAYFIGLTMNKPVISFDEFINDIEPTKGDRPRSDISPKNGKIRALFVDDSINFGNSQRRIEQHPKQTYLGHDVDRIYLAIYASENWKSDKVLTLARCELPRLFQWNYTNHGIAQHSCYDLDGVLCIDPTDEENDDGLLYRQFILSARPLYIPKYKIKAIVTSRLEKYRAETEEWLKQNNIRYDQLHMLDLPSKAERIRLKAHGSFKSDVYRSMNNAHLFVESNPGQAQQIAQRTGKAVICTENDKFYPAKKIDEIG